ncbi:CocE/NonD family hydrolase [Novosphingobium sp. MD-1]|uniref:CocE/NonD family hydrolase n=1 Tax=Novosphingobium sp. MD-1 TaxID=1630648 RepID=UPI00061BBF61|nr:CocE/NonD family hydrolase [Novosphingobium sp. MD-1]GAO53089.1 hydrolase of cocE/nonD family protein [Novosphingobium sp. MD-1]
MQAIRWVAVAAAAAIAVPGNAADYPDVQRSSLYVPVRDGTRLAVNIYRPAGGGGVESAPLPVIFVFTPYRARFVGQDGKVNEVALNDRMALRSLIAAGYVVAVADIRGKGASFGSRHGFQDRTEARDGYDLVEWLAHQPFSTGKVGMIGCSYLGGATFHTATTVPPSLKAVFIGASDLDKYAFVKRGGITAQFNTRPDEPLSEDLASVPVDADANGMQLKAAVAQHAANTPMAALWYGMPYRDSVSPLTGNAFWNEASVYNYMGAIRRAGIATYFWSNWQDEPTAQSILSAANLPGAKFLAGPGSHCVPPPGFDFTGEVRRYFDHYLKGVDNGIEREPRATYWVEGLEGKGGYVRSRSLPGEGVKPVSWFLDGGRSGSARSVNDGVLASTPANRGTDRFTVRYDLPDPDYFAFWARPMDDKGLSYTSAPLTRAMKLVGYPVVRLKVSADKPDANVFVYLDEVAADGKVEVVSFGRLALSHRKLAAAPYNTLGLPWHSGLQRDVAPLPVGQQADLAIDLTPVSRIVPAGARLRVTIAGADPRQRNLKQIMQTPAPVIAVERGGRGTSWIDLPVAD